MKLAPRDVASFLATPPVAIRVVLIFGPDRGLVVERRDRLLAAWLGTPHDPLAETVLSGDQLRADPAKLLDEAQAYALLGGRRVVRITDAGEEVVRSLRALLALPETEAPVLVEAGDLAAASGLRKLCEGDPRAVAIPCYRLEDKALARSIQDEARRLDLRLEPSALDFLTSQLGADTAITRSELDKLDLYMGERRDVRLEDAAACVGDSSALALDGLVHATATGDLGTALRLVERLLQARQAPVGVVRALQAHWQRLQRLRLLVEAGKPPAEVVETARPPIFFKARPSVRRALERHTAQGLRHGLHALVELERGLKTTGLPAADLLRHGVLDLVVGTGRPPARMVR